MAGAAFRVQLQHIACPWMAGDIVRLSSFYSCQQIQARFCPAHDQVPNYWLGAFPDYAGGKRNPVPDRNAVTHVGILVLADH
jgi:hypothetical protein